MEVAIESVNNKQTIQESVTTIPSSTAAIATATTEIKDPEKWKDLLSYWIFGLCNNFGFVVMLSAAVDIINNFNLEPNQNIEYRQISTGAVCYEISAGAILLAAIIPSLIVKFFIPFFPLNMTIRVGLACALQAIGIILVALPSTLLTTLFGVGITSFASGIGESSFLSYTFLFNKNVISTWSSGTGAAGVFGSLFYAGFIEVGVSPVITLLVMLIVPIVEISVFFFLLRRPPQNTEIMAQSTINNVSINQFKQKISLIPNYAKFFIPFTLVYLFEYFINQGLLDLIYFPNSSLSQSEQYRWLQVDYQIGVFLSRSSVNFFQIKKLWLLPMFQLINVCLVLAQVLSPFMNSFIIMLIIVLWEGLMGGTIYVNTFRAMERNLPEEEQAYAMAVTTSGDGIGISLAGLIAIPIHNLICKKL